MLIVRRDYFLSEYIFEGLDAESRKRHDIITHRPLLKKGIGHLWQKIEKYGAVHGINFPVEKFFADEYIGELRRKGTGHRSLLLFDMQNLKDIMLFRKIFPAHRIYVFVWNPARTFCRNRFSRQDYISSTRRAGIQVCTFDSRDAKEYGFREVRQPYRYPEDMPCPAADKDILFIGRDKGRSGKIERFRQLMDKPLQYTFYIQRDKHTKPVPALSPFYHDDSLDYPKTLEQIAGHKVYVELLQDNQRGMTMRPLEALFLNRKLISDNPLLQESELYHPSRILLLRDTTTPNDIIRFMQAEFEPLAGETQALYDINTWLRQFE